MGRQTSPDPKPDFFPGSLTRAQVARRSSPKHHPVFARLGCAAVWEEIAGGSEGVGDSGHDDLPQGARCWAWPQISRRLIANLEKMGLGLGGVCSSIVNGNSKSGAGPKLCTYILAQNPFVD